MSPDEEGPAAFSKHLAGIPTLHARVSQFYRKNFWNEICADTTPQALADELLEEVRQFRRAPGNHVSAGDLQCPELLGRDRRFSRISPSMEPWEQKRLPPLTPF